MAFRPPPYNPAPRVYSQSDWSHSMIGPKDDEISIVFLKDPNSKLTVLYSHGTGDDLVIISDHLKIIRHEFKTSVISYDYNGYGLSKGKMNEQNVYNNIKRVYDHCINNLKIDPKR